MKGRMILAIITAIVALALTIWCFIDGTYYIGAFALCICIAQVCNYFLIKKKRYWYEPKTHHHCTCLEHHCMCFLHCFPSNKHHRPKLGLCYHSIHSFRMPYGISQRNQKENKVSLTPVFDNSSLFKEQNKELKYW